MSQYPYLMQLPQNILLVCEKDKYNKYPTLQGDVVEIKLLIYGNF